MKTYIKFAFLIFALIQLNVFWVNPSIDTSDLDWGDVPCSLENRVFQAGETVEYTLYYSWQFLNLKAGKVQFNVTEQKDYYHMVVNGRTLKSYEWFFKVRDKYEVFVDKKTLKPIKAKKHIQEGGYQKFEELEFDWTSNKVTSHRGDSPEDQLKSKTFDLQNCEQDIVSLIYFTRNLNLNQLSTGKTIPLSLFMDEASWPLSMLYKGTTDVRVKGLGKINAHQFSPETIEGTVFSDGTTMDIFVTDDQNQLPVLIESPVSVGSVKAVLSDFKGLKQQIEFD